MSAFFWVDDHLFSKVIATVDACLVSFPDQLLDLAKPNLVDNLFDVEAGNGVTSESILNTLQNHTNAKYSCTDLIDRRVFAFTVN
jgi:hypothetical protein